MSNYPFDKKKEPSPVMAYVYAVMMACFGVFLGILYLMSYPLEAYASLEERAKVVEERESLDPVPGDAFYIEGPRLRNRSWEAKRKQLLNASTRTIIVTVGEINGWLDAKFSSSAEADEESSHGLTLVPVVPNLGISEEGTVFLNVPTLIRGFGLDDEYVLSAQVSYLSGPPARLKVSHVQFGGAPIPLPELLGAQLVSAMFKGYSSSEEYALIREAWAKVESVEVGADRLTLNLAL